MEQAPIELTPEQIGMLASRARETGKSLAALLAQALDEFQEHERADHANGGKINGHKTETTNSQPHVMQKPIWKLFAEAFDDVPEEERAGLPEDGAAQHDHYIYGLPKRPA